MTDVFISYSRKDGDFAKRLTNQLNASQRDVWIDWEDIPLTADWWSEIRRGIEASDTFVFVVSPDSLESPICQLELNHARVHNKRIVPIIRREVEQKDASARLAARDLEDNVRAALGNAEILEIARDNWNVISRHNWIFFNDDAAFDMNFQRFIAALEADLDHVREHTQLLLRALEWERKNYDRGLLLRGTRLTEAESWLTGALEKEPKPTSRHSEYISASRRSSNRTQQLVLFAVSIAMLVTLILAGVSFSLYQTAQSNANLAETNEAEAFAQASNAAMQRDLAQNNAATAERRADEAHSLALVSAGRQVTLDDDSLAPLGLPLLLEANRIPNSPPEAQIALAQVAYAPGMMSVFTHPDQAATEDVALTPDGRYLLTGGFLFEIETEELIHTFYADWGAVMAVAISQDGRRALAGTEDYTVLLWDIDPESATFGETLAVMNGHTNRVAAVDFSPDGNMAYSGGWDDLIIAWNINPESNRFGDVIATFQGHESFVSALKVAPDGETLASASWDETVILWDVATQEIIHRMAEHRDNIHALDYNGELIISGGSDDTVIVWNAETGESEYVFSGHRYDVEDVALSPVDAIGASTDNNGTLVLWDLQQGEVFSTINYRGQVLGELAFSADGTWLVVHSWNINALYRVQPGHLVQTFRAERLGDTAASENGQFVAAVDADLSVWDAETGDLLHSIPTERNNPLEVAVSSDGRYAAVGFGIPNAQPREIGEIVVWDLETEAVHFRDDVPDAVFALAFSPDDRLLGAVTGDVRVWQVADGEQIATIDYFTRSFAFSPDGQYLVTGAGTASSTTLWDIATGEAIRNYGETGFVIDAVAFTPDGEGVAAAASDGTIALWDVNTDDPQAGLIQTFSGYPRPGAIDFSPDGSMMLSVNGSYTVIWDVESGTTMRVFPADYFMGTMDGGFLSTDRYYTADRYAVRVWRHDDLSSLLSWVEDNRIVRDFTCSEREAYRIEPYCDFPDRFPTITPIELGDG